MKEIWLPVVGYEGFYEVSDHGSVRSLPRPYCVGKVLKPNPNLQGYLSVALSRPGTKVRRVSIHRLVAEAFIPNPENYPVVRHRDDIADHNHVDNLQWGTYSDNSYDAVENGNHPRSRKTHCPNGHEFTEENTYLRTNPRARRCKICVLEQNRASAERRRISSLSST